MEDLGLKEVESGERNERSDTGNRNMQERKKQAEQKGAQQEYRKENMVI